MTDLARQWTERWLRPLGEWFHQRGVHPDVISLLGVAVVAVAAICIVQGLFWVGGIVLLLGMPLDALDGAIARARGELRPFGAFLDSTLDRYADALILGAMTLYYVDSLWLVGAGLAALHGSLTVSYTRARAEGLGIDCKVGWLTRFERSAVIILALLASVIDTRSVALGLILLAVGTQITALQRIFYVREQSHGL